MDFLTPNSSGGINIWRYCRICCYKLS
uniref:Uncharacterized protein n=1 Tax=Anguilla anguilla TaxID=7936 RepID=A0A0E9RQP1_ANGAN